MRLKLLMSVFLLLQAFFILEGQEKQPRFAFITDTHIWDENSRNELVRIKNDVEKRGLDFMIIAGDLVQSGSNLMEWYLFQQAMEYGRLKCFLAVGNHDNNADWDGKNKKWAQEYMGNFQNILKKETTFTFNQGNALFCFFNPLDPNARKSAGKSGKILEEISSAINRAERDSNIKVVFLVNHYPIGLLDETSRIEILDIVRKYENVIWLNGHSHNAIIHNSHGLICIEAPSPNTKPVNGMERTDGGARFYWDLEVLNDKVYVRLVELVKDGESQVIFTNEINYPKLNK